MYTPLCTQLDEVNDFVSYPFYPAPLYYGTTQTDKDNSKVSHRLCPCTTRTTEPDKDNPKSSHISRNTYS